MVLEKDSDLLNMERAGVYDGLYHILGGMIDPLEEKGLVRERIKKLFERVNTEHSGKNGRLNTMPKAQVLQDLAQRDGASREISQQRDMRVLAKFATEAKKAFFDDLDTPKALAQIWGLVNEFNKNSSKYDTGEVLALLLELDRVLGLGFADVSEPERPNDEVSHLLKERETARKSRDFTAADLLRQKIYDLGWEIQDNPDGPRLKKI